MHSVQLFILMQLADHNGLRYSDMRPTSMEASQFMYHLKSLIQKGIAEKQANHYFLTAKGKQFIDRFDQNNMQPHDYPRVTIAVLYRHKNNGWLLVKRTQQPAIGKIGFLLVDVPIDYSMPLTKFASNSFQSITGIPATFSHRADGYIRVLNEDNLEGNMLTHVMLATGTDLPITTEQSFIWSDGANQADLFSSTTFVLDKLQENEQHFFFEYLATL